MSSEIKKVSTPARAPEKRPFACPHCGYDGSRSAKYGPEPFTYFEEVPRWQRAHILGSQLVVNAEMTFGEEGAHPFLRCNECDGFTFEDDFPEIEFEGDEFRLHSSRRN